MSTQPAKQMDAIDAYLGLQTTLMSVDAPPSTKLQVADSLAQALRAHRDIPRFDAVDAFLMGLSAMSAVCPSQRHPFVDALAKALRG